MYKYEGHWNSRNEGGTGIPEMRGGTGIPEAGRGIGLDDEDDDDDAMSLCFFLFQLTSRQRLI